MNKRKAKKFWQEAQKKICERYTYGVGTCAGDIINTGKDMVYCKRCEKCKKLTPNTYEGRRAILETVNR